MLELTAAFVPAADEVWRLGDGPPEPAGLAGQVSVLANVWPDACLRGWRGDVQLQRALRRRVVRLEEAGGIRAMKGLLGMGCRAPMVAPAAERLTALPAAEVP